MNLPIWLINALKSGEVSFSTNGVEALQLKVENRKIDLNLMNKELLKAILNITEVKEKTILKKLTVLKSIAEKLKRNGFTMTISYKDSILLTLGLEAKPTLSQFVTGTNAIEINNIRKVTHLII